MVGGAAPATLDMLVHCVVVAAGPDPGRRFRIGEAGLVVGRQPPADLVVEDPAVSRRHCRFSLLLDAVVVEDLGSTNGTFLDGVRVGSRMMLTEGAQLQLGAVRLRYERLSLAEADRLEETARDLARAQAYVTALLPAPVHEGPVLVDWVYQPCSLVGGDAFGYRQLTPTTYAIHVLDVAGHGTGAAMHSVSVLNTLRRGSLAGVDMAEPGAVVAALNALFPMEAHGELFFTLWYGVYDQASRVLAFASAGHHAGFLRSPDGTRIAPLWTRNMPIGVANKPAQAARVRVAPGCRLYLFSDGAFEFTPREGGRHAIEHYLPLLTAPELPGVSEPERLWRAQRERAQPGPLEDDVSIVVVTLP